MNKMYYSTEDLKHFSEVTLQKLGLGFKNATELILAVGVDKQEKESNFDCSFDYKFQDYSSDQGYSFHVLNLLREILKFRVKFQVIPKPNENWNFGRNKDVDLVICHPPLEKFSSDFDLLFPTLNSRLVLLYQSSDLSETDLFLGNVTGNIWFYLLSVFVLLAFCFRLSTHIHHRLRPKHCDWSWLEVTQWTLGAICQQGSAKYPQGCSCRTMFLIGYCITYMIYTAFAAGITSLLAARSDTQNLQWHNALQLDLTLIALCNSDAHRYLKHNTGNSHMNVHDCLHSEKELIETLENSESAAVMFEQNLERIVTHFVGTDVPCKLSISKESHASHFSGFVLKKNSPMKPLLNYWLLRLKEHGLLKRWLDHSLRPPPECHTPPGYTTVGYNHVRSAFIIFYFNMIVAVVIFHIELILYKYGMFSPTNKQKTFKFRIKLRSQLKRNYS